jgi:MFS family permease
VLFTYINSVMRFILFDSIIARECHIRKGWNRHGRHGLHLFVWQILLTLAFFVALAILVGLAAALAWRLDWFAHPGEHVLALVLGGCVALMLLFALILAFAIVRVMTKDFVVPQIALEDISAVEGWRRLWAWLKAEKAGYAGYIGMKIVMAIGAGIVFGMIALMIFFMLLIPIGGAGLLAVLAGKAAGLAWTFYTITLAVLAGCVALAIFLFAASVISVPAVVFFPAYSIYFFAPRYPILAALLWPQPAPSETQSLPPTEPPPSPPTQAPSG